MSRGEVTCDVCHEAYEPCDGHRCDGGLAELREDLETAEETVATMTKALLAVEVVTRDSLGSYPDWVGCGLCGDSVENGTVVHYDGCTVDESLTAAGLDTPEKRNARRAEIAASAE